MFRVTPTRIRPHFGDPGIRRIDDDANSSASWRTGSATCRIPARQPNRISRSVCANAAFTSRSPRTTTATYFPPDDAAAGASSVVGTVAPHWNDDPGAVLNVAVVSSLASNAPDKPLYENKVAWPP